MLTGIISLILIGCSKSNPLLNDETIADLKHFIAFNAHDKNFDIDCKSYLLGIDKPNNELKSRCDKTVSFIFDRFKDRDNFATAKLEDLHDPKLWERIFSVKGK